MANVATYVVHGTLGGIRTPDARLRTAALYPAELPGHMTIVLDVNYYTSQDIRIS